MTSAQAPTVDLDQIIDPNEWTILKTDRQAKDAITEDEVPWSHRKTVCIINERTGFIAIDKVRGLQINADGSARITTMNYVQATINPEQKIYLYSPREPLPTKTGSKIYNVTVQDLTQSDDDIEYLFDSLTIDGDGTWFGLNQYGMLHLVEEDYESVKITKFSLTPNDSNN